jgi:nicotinamide riboside transporter PnuC
MLHIGRRHSVTVVDDISELAAKLTEHTWTLCTGFRCGGWLFLNDSFSEDGAQEYSVLRATPNADGTHDVCESVTFGWMSRLRAEHWLAMWMSSSHEAKVYKSIFRKAHAEGVCGFCA